jgi:hypothetical protein
MTRADEKDDDDDERGAVDTNDLVVERNAPVREENGDVDTAKAAVVANDARVIRDASWSSSLQYLAGSWSSLSLSLTLSHTLTPVMIIS